MGPKPGTHGPLEAFLIQTIVIQKPNLTVQEGHRGGLSQHVNNLERSAQQQSIQTERKRMDRVKCIRLSSWFQKFGVLPVSPNVMSFMSLPFIY